MNERPILFSGEMVRAILEGRKSQTRRVIVPQPMNDLSWAKQGKKRARSFYASEYAMRGDLMRSCCYGQPGDCLWVRETWRCEERGKFGVDGIHYRADDAFIKIENSREAADLWMDAHRDGDPWRPSIFMPRWASRITLEIVSVRVERVQEIGEADAEAEGMVSENGSFYNARHEYQVLWDKINARRGFGWSVNPWVWVIEFRVLEVKHG